MEYLKGGGVISLKSTCIQGKMSFCMTSLTGGHVLLENILWENINSDE